MNWQKLLNWLSLIVLSMWAGFIIQIFVWLHYPVNVVDFYNTPARILNGGHTVKRGQWIEYEVSYQKFLNIPASRISRSLVNDRVVTLTETQTGALQPSDECKKTSIKVFIPFNVWPGKYFIQVDMAYDVNPIRTVHEQYRTEWFEVTE